jgi:hypothetical protein
MSESFALHFGVFLHSTGALVTVVFLPTGLPARQYLAAGTNLFPTSGEAGKALRREGLPAWSLCGMVDPQKEGSLC